MPTPVGMVFGVREQAAITTTKSSIAAARNAVLMGAVMTTGRLLKGNNLKHGIYRA
ncbi:hypothetical protein D3C86_2208740 [compost metagenome]